MQRPQPQPRRFRTSALPRRLAAVGLLAQAAPWVARPARAAITWTAFSHQLAPAAASARGLLRLSDAVREGTVGELLINVRTAGRLPIDAADVLNATASGQIQIGDDGYHTASIAAALVLRLPMLITTPAEYDADLAIARPMIDAECAARGLVLLGIWRTPQQIVWSRLKTTGFADIARQRLRVLAVEQAEFVRHYGGLHLMMANAEVSDALAATRLDGAITTATLGGQAWKSVLKYAYRAGPNFSDGLLVANRAALERLPSPVQEVLRAAAATATTWITETQAAEEAATQRELLAQGTTITPADPADVKEAVRKLTQYWDNWVRLKGRDSETLLGQLRQTLDR